MSQSPSPYEVFKVHAALRERKKEYSIPLQLRKILSLFCRYTILAGVPLYEIPSGNLVIVHYTIKPSKSQEKFSNKLNIYVVYLLLKLCKNASQQIDLSVFCDIILKNALTNIL